MKKYFIVLFTLALIFVKPNTIYASPKESVSETAQYLGSGQTFDLSSDPNCSKYTVDNFYTTGAASTEANKNITGVSGSASPICVITDTDTMKQANCATYCAASKSTGTKSTFNNKTTKTYDSQTCKLTYKLHEGYYWKTKSSRVETVLDLDVYLIKDTSKITNLGKSTSYDINKLIPGVDASKLTEENFMFSTLSTSTSYTCYTTSIPNCGAQQKVIKEYNPSTGILEFNYRAYNGGYQNANIYYVPLDPDVKTLEKPSMNKDEFIYNSKNQSLELNGYDEEYMYIEGNVNIDAGEYTATVSLKDITKTKWNDETTGPVEFTWKIKPYDISNAVINTIDKQYYEGSNIEPQPVIKALDKTLINNIDYSLTYVDNNKEGTAKLVATGMNNFTGTKEIEFEIENKTYTIQYNLNADGDAVNNVKNPSTYKYGDEIILQNPVRPNYEFMGWSPEGVITETTDGDLTFTANWREVLYKFDYEYFKKGEDIANNAVIQKSYYSTSESYKYSPKSNVCDVER